jgi:DUF4097 and DUF4098 domain-containing protein YvlB
MKKKEIIIVVVVIAFGIIYNFVKSSEIRFYSGCSVGSRSLLDKKHPKDFIQKEIEYPAGTIGKIKINNPAGDIEVEKSKEGSILVKPVIRVYHKNKEKAKKICGTIEVSNRKIGKKIVIGVDSEGRFPYRRVRVGFKCLIPEDMELDLKNRYGNIDIQDAGQDIEIDERHGNLFIKNIDSNLKVKSDHGRIRLYDIKDQIQLSSNHSRIKIKNVASIILKCSHANLSINDVKEETEIVYASHSLLDIEKTNYLYIDARYTKMKLENLKDGVKINNSHAPIYMKDITGNINIKAKQCKMALDKVISEYLTIKNSYNDIDIEDISGKNLNLFLKNGDLTIAFDNIEEEINIKTEHADVELTYPNSVVPAFNITSKNGRIMNRTAAELTVLEENQKRMVNILEGKPQIIVDTLYGDVILKNSGKQK